MSRRRQNLFSNLLRTIVLEILKNRSVSFPMVADSVGIARRHIPLWGKAALLFRRFLRVCPFLDHLATLPRRFLPFVSPHPSFSLRFPLFLLEKVCPRFESRIVAFRRDDSRPKRPGHR